MPQQHESYRVSAKPVIFTMATVIGALSLALVMLYVIYNAFLRPETSAIESAVMNAGPERIAAPAFDAQQARKMEVLHSYGWIAEDRQIARIPVEEAFALALESYGQEPQSDTRQRDQGGRR